MLGIVAALRRYPVKSGKVASAKYPRLWRDLLTASAVAADDAVLITLPSGKTVWSNDANVDTILSELLNEPVTLTATRPPAAALDRAVPEAVLRAGIHAQVPFVVNEIGAGSRRAPSSTSRRCTC